MDFDAFIRTGWAEHGDQPQVVADRLAGSLGMIETAEQVPRFAGLATHVFGEHLAEWERGAALLESIHALPAVGGDAAALAACARSIAALRHANGDVDALDGLSLDDRVAAVATVASAFTGQGRVDAAIDAYGEALRLAADGLTPGCPAIRSLAVGGNNLASALESKSDRDARQTDGMLAAAQGGLTYWKLAGTWLEEERAEYRLARSLLQAGRAAEASEAAYRCVAVCEANAAPAFELFFAHAVTALAHRAGGDAAAFEASRRRARAFHEQVPEDERTWCVADLQELDAPTG